MAFNLSKFNMTNYSLDKRFVKQIRSMQYFILALTCFFIIEKNTEGAELFSVQSISIDGMILPAISSDSHRTGVLNCVFAKSRW